MARMYPSEVREDTKSPAERWFFDVIEKGLSDDWIGLHSLGLAVHASKAWAEIDFILIGPTGLYCLEVKGGGVARSNGRYVFTNRDGAMFYKDEGPFEQVATARAALHKHLKVQMAETFPPYRQAMLRYGVVTPDIEWSIDGPDIEPKVVYDRRDKVRPIWAYVADWTSTGPTG